ncbi:MAG: endonuclease III domain-containing protein [Candidatus Omnitrophica bacterium]|jgi:endonuclease-3 related protein|nr:endonuclease III domain-containing protein [Candidatus Omnitrophota bacterium]
MDVKKELKDIYKKLFRCFGRQYWWPAESPFEVMVGAILTQNTNWRNVEKAIGNLKQNKALDPFKMLAMPHKKLACMIRPAGYYNIKTKRLKEFLKFFTRIYKADFGLMRAQNTDALRKELLAVKGIGEETADSILLYALSKPVFVIDAYTKRLLARHNFIAGSCLYQQAQKIFMENLNKDVKMFNEYHALIVKLNKEFCLKNNPRCRICPLK